MNNAKRYVVRQLLHAIGVHMRVDYHELYRVAHTERNGLTNKEREFLIRTLRDYDAVNTRVSKLGTHLQKGLS